MSSNRNRIKFRPVLEHIEGRLLPGELLGTGLSPDEAFLGGRSGAEARPLRQSPQHSIPIEAVPLTGVEAESAHSPALEDQPKITVAPTVDSRMSGVPQDGLFIVGNETGGQRSGICSRFAYGDFQSTEGLHLNGNAETADGKLRLSNATTWQRGTVWTERRHPIEEGFTTSFQFQITQPGGSGPGADGFTFGIQNTSVTSMGDAGGYIGYGGSGGIPNSLVVEFDTFKNSSFGDPNANHLSVHTRGTLANSANESYSIGLTTNIPTLDDGAIHSVVIAYQPNSMSIYIDDMATPKLTVGVNLATTLSLASGTAWVGFTAATASGYENHDILSWRFAGCS